MVVFISLALSGVFFPSIHLMVVFYFTTVLGARRLSKLLLVVCRWSLARGCWSTTGRWLQISSSLADTVWSGPPTVGDGRLDSVVDCNARTPGVMGARRGRRHVSAGWSSLDIAWILSDGLRGTFPFCCLHHLCDIMFCFLVFQYAAECCDWIRGSVENS